MSARLTGAEAQAILDGLDDETSEPAELRVEGEPVFDASGEQVFLHTGRARVVQSAERALREVVTLERERDDAAARAAASHGALVRVFDALLGDLRPPPGVASGAVPEIMDVGRFVRRERADRRAAALNDPEKLAAWAAEIIEHRMESEKSERDLRLRDSARAAALMHAVDALHGAAPGIFDDVTPDAMRAVMTRRGWALGGTQRFDGGSDEVAFEVWRHDTALGVCRVRKTVRSALLPVARLVDYAARVVDWCEILSSRHGDVAPASVLAEVLMEVLPWKS